MMSSIQAIVMLFRLLATGDEDESIVQYGIHKCTVPTSSCVSGYQPPCYSSFTYTTWHQLTLSIYVSRMRSLVKPSCLHKIKTLGIIFLLSFRKKLENAEDYNGVSQTHFPQNKLSFNRQTLRVKSMEQRDAQ